MTATVLASAGLVMVACAPVSGTLPVDPPEGLSAVGTAPAAPAAEATPARLDGPEALGPPAPPEGLSPAPAPRPRPKGCPAIPREIRAEAQAAPALDETIGAEARTAAALRQLVALYERCRTQSVTPSVREAGAP